MFASDWTERNVTASFVNAETQNQIQALKPQSDGLAAVGGFSDQLQYVCVVVVWDSVWLDMQSDY